MKLIEKMDRQMAGMRNILVHAYATIQRDLIVGSLKSLEDNALRIARALRRLKA